MWLGGRQENRSCLLYNFYKLDVNLVEIGVELYSLLQSIKLSFRAMSGNHRSLHQLIRVKVEEMDISCEEQGYNKTTEN